METDRNGARNSSKYLITEGFAEWGMLFVLAPLASLSLAGQEHGRTIPLANIRKLAPKAPACMPVCGQDLCIRGLAFLFMKLAGRRERNWAKPEVETRIAVDERHGTRAA